MHHARVPVPADACAAGAARPSAPLATYLQRAVVAALVQGAAEADDARSATHAYVADLKARGLTAPRVVIALKEAMVSAPFPPTARVEDLDAWRERVVGWGIAAYFRDD